VHLTLELPNEVLGAGSSTRCRDAAECLLSRHAAPSHTARRSTRTRLTWAVSIVAIVVAATLVIVFGRGYSAYPARTVAGPSAPAASPGTTPPMSSQQPSSAPIPPSTLEPEFKELQGKLRADIGLVISAVGTGKDPVVLGNPAPGPAWSTIKVPLALAVLRAQGSADVTDTMRAAIVDSDNGAAESLWESLGDPDAAARKVEAVLKEYGDLTVVESRRLRPEFSAFGQTEWSLVNQTAFVARSFCEDTNSPIFDLMGQVSPGQQWGIFQLPDSKFKGGWGPSTSGSYLVRQIGVFSTGTGMVAVAMAAQPASGSFEEGTQDLDEIARWLGQHMAMLPSSRC
jgi:hypothetical protein